MSSKYNLTTIVRRQIFHVGTHPGQAQQNHLYTENDEFSGNYLSVNKNEIEMNLTGNYS